MKNNTVYIISGPTASGKSLIALALAKRIDGEIINCDSIQLYKYMDIGSAKPASGEMQTVKHHLYSIVEPDYNMTVAAYQKLALALIDDVLSRGKTPIVCGGTGLYLNSILYDMNFAGCRGDSSRRAELEEMALKNGGEYMHQYLKALDTESAERIHPNNIRKIIRAIEAYEQGTKIGSLADCPPNPKYNFKFFALTMDRERLYERINDRVQKLFEAGLVNEVRTLLSRGYTASIPAMKAIGYKEVISFLKGECDLDTAADEIRKNTRHYAKRQLTWLKRYDNVKWLDVGNITSAEEAAELMLREASDSESGMADLSYAAASAAESYTE